MTLLERIVEEKRRYVSERLTIASREAVAALAQRADPPRDFHGAVSRRGAVIAELKRRTPTIASFTHSQSLLELASVYAANGAAAISIVTDPGRFGTSNHDIASVRAATPLPVIAKDFVIDPYQIYEARAADADAILLIARLLDTESLRGMLAVTRQLGMSALVETHTEPEVLAALSAGARIIGINNRDLDTMTVSIDTTRRLARLVPDGIVLVAESGLQSRDDVADLAVHGASAFLIGGSLLAAQDPGALLRDFVEAGRTPRSASGKRFVR